MMRSDTLPLTASDRCDKCGAAAYVRVTFTSGELLFCGHHGAEYLDGVATTAVDIYDELDRLTRDATAK